MRRRQALKLTGGLLTGVSLAFLLSQDDGFNEVIEHNGKTDAFANPKAAPPPPSEAIKMEQKSRDQILWTASRPWMRMTARAEGTYVPTKPEMNPYTVIFTYKTFSDFSDHPRQSIKIPGDPRNRSSDAAGAYQFLSSTWDRLPTFLPIKWHEHLPAFGPRNQDLGFLHLHADTGAHGFIAAGCRTLGGLSYVDYSHFKKAIYCDSREWASFPGKDIGKDSGQSTRDISELWSWFSWELNKEQGLLHKTIVPPEDFSADNISSLFGWRWHPVRQEWAFHNGVDWPTVTGTPIRAPEAGRVAKYWLGGGGNTLVFRPHTDPFKVVRFMHLDRYANNFKDDMWVEQGQVIGYTGDTGSSTTGPHLHAEVWQGVDPRSWGLQNAGPVDPLPYFKLGEYLA